MKILFDNGIQNEVHDVTIQKNNVDYFMFKKKNVNKKCSKIF